MNDIETIQKARGWRECDSPIDCDYWVLPDANKHQLKLPDPLADTPEGWWEFGQIITWAMDEKRWNLSVEPYRDVAYQADIYKDDGLWLGVDYGSFREAIIGAIAEAVRHESEDKE